MVSPEPPAPERLPRLSRRAVALGSLGVLAAAAVLATMGFTAGHHDDGALAAGVRPSSSTTAQLPTYSLSEERELIHLPRP